MLPATHWASPRTEPDLPRMGERLRLRKDFDVSGFPPHAQAILKGLKKLRHVRGRQRQRLADVDRPRPPAEGLETLHRVKGSDFEVVDTGARSVEGD